MQAAPERISGICASQSRRLARILREHPECRLVLFRSPDAALAFTDIEEYPSLIGLERQVEWRSLQPLMNLPAEMARFDINLAPLEVGNPFCEAKSELKFFDAALVNVPTIASPTGPFRRAIDHGRTGFLATSGDDWYLYIKRLVQDPALREQLGRNAYIAALAAFGPRQRALRFGRVIENLRGGVRAARGFALEANLSLASLEGSEGLSVGSDLREREGRRGDRFRDRSPLQLRESGRRSPRFGGGANSRLTRTHHR